MNTAATSAIDDRTDTPLGGGESPTPISEEQARRMFGSDEPHKDGELPNGFQVEDPGLKSWILKAGRRLDNTVHADTEKAGTDADASPEERALAKFEELRQQLKNARAVHEALGRPAAQQDPRLTRAARYNLTRIASLATDMLDNDEGSENPMGDARARTGGTQDLADQLAQLRRSARESEAGGNPEPWKALYASAGEPLLALEAIVEDRTLVHTMKDRADKAKGARLHKSTWDNTGRTLTENAHNAVGEVFEGKGHDDDFQTVLKLLSIGHGIAAPATGSTLASMRAGIYGALLPAVRAGQRMGVEWYTRDTVGAERTPEEVIAERGHEANTPYDIADADAQRTRIGPAGEERPAAPKAEDIGAGPTQDAKRERDAANRAVLRLERAVETMPKTLRARIARDLRRDGAKPPDWRALAKPASPGRRQATLFATGAKAPERKRREALIEAVEKNTELPEPWGPFVEQMHTLLAPSLRPDTNDTGTPRERIEGAAGLIAHMGEIEIAHEQLGQAGKLATRLERDPAYAESLASNEQKGNQLLVKNMKTFAVLGVGVGGGASASLDDVSCEDIVMRTNAVWWRIPERTRVDIAGIDTGGRGNAPGKDSQHVPDMAVREQARWCAHAGHGLHRRVRNIHKAIETRLGIDADTALFAQRRAGTARPDGAER